MGLAPPSVRLSESEAAAGEVAITLPKWRVGNAPISLLSLLQLQVRVIHTARCLEWTTIATRPFNGPTNKRNENQIFQPNLTNE